MKKVSIVSVWSFTIVAFISACKNEVPASKPVKQFPSPGTVMAKDSMPILTDNLNHFTFSIKVIADSNVTSGTYDVDADFGPNFAEGRFTMPKGLEDARPLIRRGKEPYTFIIGFKAANDTAFYDFFQVSSNHNQTTMKYIKAYTFN